MSYILQQINDYTYSLKIQGCFKPLYKTIIKVLKNAYYDAETDSLYFAAEQVVKFETIVFSLRHNLAKCVSMLDNLTTQMAYLKTLNYGFYGFDLNSILVVDNYYLVCDSSYLYPIETTETTKTTETTFTFIEPIQFPQFSSPEINKLTSLPSVINYKCCYYSLGTFTAYCLLNINLTSIKNEDEVETKLKPISNSKMYWFLKRCLHKNIDERILLLI